MKEELKEITIEHIIAQGVSEKVARFLKPYKTFAGAEKFGRKWAEENGYRFKHFLVHVKEFY